jgi:hypothetical protein
VVSLAGTEACPVETTRQRLAGEIRHRCRTEQIEELDVLPVLDDEDEQYRQAAERGDRPAAESSARLFRFTLLTHHSPNHA